MIAEGFVALNVGDQRFECIRECVNVPILAELLRGFDDFHDKWFGGFQAPDTRF